jgi:hypothetical protein
MSASLKLATKIAVFERGAMPWPPLVGERWIVASSDQPRMTLLDRERLTVVSQHDMPEAGPVQWIGPEQLLMVGRFAGVWDATQQDWCWRKDSQAGLGAWVWRDYVETWESASQLALRRATGEIERVIDFGADVMGSHRNCGDVIVYRTPKTGDPVHGFSVADGRIAWRRDLHAELNERCPGHQSTEKVSITPGSLPEVFVATRGRLVAGCSLSDGAIRWTASDVSVPYSWPLIERERIPIWNGSRFTVIDEATGTILVDRQHPELQGVFHEKSGSILGDLVVFVSESGHVVAFDLQNGDLRFNKQHKKVAFWGTAVADGRVLASGTDGNIWVYEAR